jgi:hypothetical protein
MFSWVRFYRRLVAEAKERAERATEPSVQTTYQAMADDWAARLKEAEQEEDRRNEFFPRPACRGWMDLP